MRNFDVPVSFAICEVLANESIILLPSEDGGINAKEANLRDNTPLVEDYIVFLNSVVLWDFDEELKEIFAIYMKTRGFPVKVLRNNKVGNIQVNSLMIAALYALVQDVIKYFAKIFTERDIETTSGKFVKVVKVEDFLLSLRRIALRGIEG